MTRYHHGTRTTFETTQPWVVYRMGLTHDRWWPFWTSTRVLGRARVECTCAVCGRHETITVRLPRVGPVTEPAGSAGHPARTRFCTEHIHPDRGAPMSWALPMLNPNAHAAGIDLDALAMRLDADLNQRDTP